METRLRRDGKTAVQHASSSINVATVGRAKVGKARKAKVRFYVADEPVGDFVPFHIRTRLLTASTIDEARCEDDVAGEDVLAMVDTGCALAIVAEGAVPRRCRRRKYTGPPVKWGDDHLSRGTPNGAYLCPAERLQSRLG